MENFIVSARKYRPPLFSSVVGQDSITRTLRNAIASNKLAQAFLFTGPRGVGKTTCARILAKTINCTNVLEGYEPCNECESCVTFNNNASFNIYELDAASNNSVDDIRALVDQVRIPPQAGKYKVYIIDEVHMLSAAAFNAFLKTLEEPPPYAKFILATTEKHKIIPTILSRCQIFDFRRIGIKDIVAHLKHVAHEEGVEIEENALHIIATKADGGMRDALSIFDQLVSYAGNHITYKKCIENLNVLDYDYYFRMTDFLLRAEMTQLLLLIEEVFSNGFDGLHFVNGLSAHFRNILLSKDVQTRPFLEVSEDILTRYAEQSALCSTAFLIKGIDLLTRCDLDYRISGNKRLLIELTMMKVGSMGDAALPPQTQEIKAPNPTAVQQVAAAPKPSPAKVVLAPPVVSKATPKPVSKPVQPVEPELKPAVKSSEKSKPYLSAVKPMQVNEPVSTGISLKDIRQRRSLEVERQKKKSEKKSTPFSQQQLEEAWREYSISFQKEEPRYYNMMVASLPQKNGENSILFSVNNNLQQEQFKEKKPLLIESLRQAFDNNTFTIEIQEVERKVETKPYTSRDKYAAMLKKNSGLETLRNQLDLSIE